MPIYNYQCATCGNTKEVLQKLSAPPPMCVGLVAELSDRPDDSAFNVTSVSNHGPMEKQLNSGYAFTFGRGKGTSGGNSMRMPTKQK